MTDTYKMQRYQHWQVQERLAQQLPSWSVEVLTFTMGVRGSFSEPVWQAHLERLGLTPGECPALMLDLVAACLQELDSLFKCRSYALQANHAGGH